MDWPRRCVPAASFDGFDRLVDRPERNIFVAASFAQEDEAGGVKLRRGEDWRRFHRNAAVLASGRLRGGHDLPSAYRQWPVKEPSHSGAILHTASGPTLWFHFAMCFGAGAGDALQFLTRALLFIVHRGRPLCGRFQRR